MKNFGGCGCIFLVLLVLFLNFYFGGVCLNYDLKTTMGVEINWLLASLIGLVFGEIIFPVTLLIWLINLAPNIPHPWFK